MDELNLRSNGTLSDAIRIALMIAVEEKRGTLIYLLEMAMLEAETCQGRETSNQQRHDSLAS